MGAAVQNYGAFHRVVLATSIAAQRIGRGLWEIEVRPLISWNRIAELEFEVSDVSLIGGQLAFESEVIPSSIAVKRGALSDDGVAFSNDRPGRISDDEVDGIFIELPIDLKDRFEIAQLLGARLRLQVLERLNGLAIARVGQFL